MALVAYSDDSDLASDSEDVEEPPKVIVNGESKAKQASESSEKGRAGAQIDPEADPKADPKAEAARGGVEDIVDFDEDVTTGARTGLLASIPRAKPIAGTQAASVPLGEEVDEVTDVPTVDTWKVTQKIKEEGGDSKISSASSVSVTTKKKKEKKKIQFIIPSLSEFAEEEEEEEKEVPERKKVQPSSLGTGLFAVLPEPKNLAVKETKRSLVPHILTKRPTEPLPKKPRKAPMHVKPLVEANDSDEEAETGGSSDFFSLTETAPDPATLGRAVPSISTAPDVEPPVSRTPASQNLPEDRINEPVASAHAYTDNAYQTHNEKQDFYPVNELEEQTPQPASFDHEAMLRLTGKRRGKGEAINFIDVSADDALLTRDEWMTKALTEEKPTQSFSKKREGMPSQRTKQKHQITFLAHQAKERELELKNNWAQNRMTKMQTQAKYGF
ncbi:proline-rich protein PRCC-like [Penaeus chinensis]|uniref:proline-rich protein PRCC-like n=1 Tax=Penaeus chinensis TaxID=139456 RepID=UPI001FB58561|nr:proline-rich protein PRCC-like [Penaeus chinensis]